MPTPIAIKCCKYPALFAMDLGGIEPTTLCLQSTRTTTIQQARVWGVGLLLSQDLCVPTKDRGLCVGAP